MFQKSNEPPTGSSTRCTLVRSTPPTGSQDSPPPPKAHWILETRFKGAGGGETPQAKTVLVPVVRPESTAQTSVTTVDPRPQIDLSECSLRLVVCEGVPGYLGGAS